MQNCNIMNLPENYNQKYCASTADLLTKVQLADRCFPRQTYITP